MRGVTGFGHKQTIKVKYPAIPERKSDIIVEEKSQENQAFIYRLNGDYNALHIHPDFAALGNFNKPIIQGLCTFGFTASSLY